MSQEDLDLGMLDKMINYYLQKNKSKLDDELISKIHKQVYVQYNTLNIAVGRQRCGKTHTIIKERYSPITATNSMLYSKSRQLFVYAFN